MRTPNEMVARCKKPESFFGFDVEVIVPYLSFADAKPLLKPEAKEEEWQQEEYTRAKVIADMAEYMQFAWQKAEAHRGLSSNRSVEKIGAYLWLLGDDDLCRRFEETEYTNYGCPKLMMVCKEFGLPFPDSEAIQRMARGESCEDGCESGCGV